MRKYKALAFKQQKKRETTAEEEKMDATPTPLERSNRLHKLTSPSRILLMLRG